MSFRHIYIYFPESSSLRSSVSLESCVDWDRKSETQESHLVFNGVELVLGLSMVSITYVVSEDTWDLGIPYTYFFFTVLFVYLVFLFFLILYF